MNFRWSMDEYDFERLQEHLKSNQWHGDNCYRGVAIGSMLWEFTTDMADGNKIKLLANVYEAGVKDAWYGTLKDGMPYDHVDCYDGNYLGLITTKSFEDFKESVQLAIITLSCAGTHLKEMMHANMEPMWYGF